jgi:hypothetical protein
MKFISWGGSSSGRSESHLGTLLLSSESISTYFISFSFALLEIDEDRSLCANAEELKNTTVLRNVFGGCEHVAKMPVFSVAAPCSLVEVYRRFRSTCSLHLHIRHRENLIPYCSWYACKNLITTVFKCTSRLQNEIGLRVTRYPEFKTRCGYSCFCIELCGGLWRCRCYEIRHRLRNHLIRLYGRYKTLYFKRDGLWRQWKCTKLKLLHRNGFHWQTWLKVILMVSVETLLRFQRLLVLYLTNTFTTFL